MPTFDGFPHVMVSQQFSRQWIVEEFFPLVDQMKHIFVSGGCDMLKGKRMVSFFYQPSTRTRMSFEFAIGYLGGNVLFSTENAREFSSGAKGESLKDTILVINRYRPDVIVLRYDRELGSEVVSGISRVPVINAGDRNPGQHPTQGLLDLNTIKKHFGHIDGLTVTMVGDLKNGRTVRSLSYLLGKFGRISINFVSPPNLAMKSDVKEYLFKHGVEVEEFTDLRRVAPASDVIYQTRTQTECGSTMNGKDGYFRIDQTILDMLNTDTIIMHPLPKLDEIASEVDDDSRAVYLTDQIDSGLFTRMALLKMILAPKR